MGFENIRDEFKDPDGDFSALRMFAFLPQYAKNGLSTTSHELTDLLSDEYRGGGERSFQLILTMMMRFCMFMMK